MQKISISFRIWFLYLIINIPLLAGMFFFFRWNLQDQYYSRIKESLAREALFAKEYLELRDDVKMSPASLQDALGRLARGFGNRVSVIDAEGHVLADSGVSIHAIPIQENQFSRPEIQEAMEKGKGSHRRFNSELNSEVFYYAVAVKRGGWKGFLRLANSSVENNRVIVLLNKQIVVGFVLTLLASIIIFIVVRRLWVLPIRELSGTASSIASGNLDERAAVLTNKELGGLAGALNRMSEQTKRQIEEATLGRLRLEAVFLSMFDGVMVLDVDGNILLMNRALKNFLKVEGDPVGRQPLEVIRDVDIGEIVEDVLVKKCTIRSREINIFLPEEKSFLVQAAPVVRDGKTDGAVIVLQDVTDFKKLERVRQDFVANASHELRTPVASIKGYAETLLEGALADKANARDFVAIIHDDANRLEKLINDLLDLAKIESGKMKPSLQPTRIEPIIDRAVATLARVAGEQQVSIRQEMPTGLPMVMADEAGLAQIFWNLLENAIKYNKENGSVKIAAYAQTEHVVIEVSDTGIGIQREEIPRIFERFYRVDKAHSRQLGGTGLGLSIVKRLVQSFHGDISVISEPGEGSTFRITLPKA